MRRTAAGHDLASVTTEQVAPSARPGPISVETSFTALYRTHYRDVYRYVLCLTRSHEDAEDVTGETFERALRADLDGRGPEEKPLSWLLLTARRIATDRWRRARRFVIVALSLSATATEPAEGRTEFWLWFRALADVLSDRQREVLLLRYQRDLTDEEIGLIMGLSPSGVRSLVARALATLRTHPEVLP